MRDEFYLKWINNLAKIYICLNEAKRQSVRKMIKSLGEAKNRDEFEKAASGIYAMANNWKKQMNRHPQTIEREVIKIFIAITEMKRETGEIFKWSIRTEHKGIQMRSRLEKKWAEYFDIVGVNWEYEPSLYERNGLKYLPDFALPDLKIVFEAKGVMNVQDELKKIMMAEICDEMGWRYVMGFSDVPKAYLIKADGSEVEFDWMEGE